MKTPRNACSLWISLFIAFAAIPALAQTAGGGGDAPKPAVTAAPDGAKAAPTAPKPVSEEEKKRRQQASLDRQKATYLAQVESLGLSDEQLRQVETLPARQAAWQEANAPKIAEIRKRTFSAPAGGDAQPAKPRGAEMQELMQTRPELKDILTKEQFEKMTAAETAKRQATIKAAAAARGAKPPPPGANKNSPEVQAIYAQMEAARKAGDTATVERLQIQLRMLKDAVRKKQAAEAAAQKAAPK